MQSRQGGLLERERLAPIRGQVRTPGAVGGSVASRRAYGLKCWRYGVVVVNQATTCANDKRLIILRKCFLS